VILLEDYSQYLIKSTSTQAIIATAILVLAFIIGSVTEIHMGVLVISTLALVGPLLYHDTISTLQSGWNTNLMFTLIGVTYLFALANNNGTVDWIVAMGVKAVAGKVAFFPFAMFLICAILTAIGCATPAAAAILMPIALAFNRNNNINPIPMAQAVIQGASAGSLSPLGVYGIIIKGVVDNKLYANADGTLLNQNFSPLVMWAVGFLIFLLVVVAVWILYPKPGPTEAEVAAAEKDESIDLEGSADSLVDEEFGDFSGAAEFNAEIKLNGERTATLFGIIALAAIIIVGSMYKTPLGVNLANVDADGKVVAGWGGAGVKLLSFIDVGWTALAIGAVLTLIFPKAAKGAVSQVAWPTLLLVCGIVTYISLLEKHGVVSWIGHMAAGIGNPVFTCIVIFFVAAFVSAYASTTGLFPILIPISVPFIASKFAEDGVTIEPAVLSATMLLTALSVSASTVDCSPFSTNGALGVANGAHQADYVYKGLFLTSWVTIIGTPIITWALLILPPWGRV
jgi:di/tricarboxylate transporter